MPERMARVLYAEDDPDMGAFVRTVLARLDCEVEIAATGKAFRERLSADPPDLCLVDVLLPDVSGLDLIAEVSAGASGIPTIVLTKVDSADQAIRAIRLGAADYLTKPLDPQRLSVTVRNALRIAEQRREIDRLQTDSAERSAVDSLLGNSPHMEELRRIIRKSAKSDLPVLVLGESGTGKELVSRALHSSSERSRKPLVVVNCAAVSDSLLESELFGHEKGAFTGAAGKRRGYFEQAHEGTIFLDEIGDMPLSTQAKILRLLEDRRLRRVGGEQELSIDVRVVCATNRDLDAEVVSGKFRKDLLFRINAISIQLPSLKSRVEDVPLLASHFLRSACRRLRCPMAKISDEALDLLKRHDWPGNVRELEHVIERAVVMCDGDEVKPSHLPSWTVSAAPVVAGGLIEEVERLERARILEALARNDWVKARAARELGLTKRMISYKIEILGIRAPGQ